MSDIRTATVEALTAEVRVLMVGSRQITLSVARQLDSVAPSGITPFGRIAADRHPGDHQIEVIGADGDGVLVTSKMGFTWKRCMTVGGLIDNVWHPRAKRQEPCGKCTIDNDDHDWPRYWGSGDRAIYADWMGLPLIILAGLR